MRAVEIIENNKRCVMLRTSCACGLSEHALNLSIEVDKYGSITAYLLSEAAYTESWQTGKFKFFKNWWEKIKTCWKVIFNGEIKTDVEFIFNGEQPVEDFKDSLEQCLQEAKNRKMMEKTNKDDVN